MWLTHLAAHCARSWPERTALTDQRRELTFRQLADRSSSLATALEAAGVRRGSRVAVASGNRSEVIEIYLAVAQLGAAFVPLNPHAPAATSRAAAVAVGVQLFLGEADVLERIDVAVTGVPAHPIEGRWYTEATSGRGRTIPPDADPTGLAAVFHTSATTGTSKAVGIDHRHFCAAALGLLAGNPIPGDTVVLVGNPLYHGSMFLSLTYLSQGARLVLLPSFTPQGALAAIAREHVTHLWLVPEMLRFLIRARALAGTDTSSLREVIYAAAPMPPDLLREARDRLGCDFRQVYGMTEALIIACLRPADHEFPGSDGDGRSGPVGRPVPGLAVEVRDENDKVLPNGGIGQVCVRGDGQMSGYLGDATATRQVMPDGWLRTGDLGRFDESGLLHLAGRLKDVIIRGGQKVSPLEVEAALEQHPQVGQAAVIGVPDPDWGEVPVAFVVPVPGEPMDPDDVLRFCVGRLAAYQRPVTLTVLSALPRGATGKLLRRELRDLADDRSRLAS